MLTLFMNHCKIFREISLDMVDMEDKLLCDISVGK